MNVRVEISIGEFFDKLTILEIKRSRIEDVAKLENIKRELDGLNRLLEELPFSRKDVSAEVDELKAINERALGDRRRYPRQGITKDFR